MDIDIILNSQITVWILAVADVVLLSIVFYSIYLFRKETYNIEKYIKKNLKHKKNDDNY